MKITNNLGLPQPFVDAVTKQYQYKEKQYSVTSLLKGTCQTLLERRHNDEIEQDVSDMVWAIFGTAVHSILEKGQETADQLKENYLVINIGDYKLSGIFDLYDSKEEKVIDYKTGSIWKVQFDDWKDYQQQLLIYAYMLEKIEFKCKTGEIVMLLKDHSKTKASTDSSYPQYPVVKRSWNYTEQDFKDCEEFLINKFKDIEIQEALSDEELTPCSEIERWHKDDTYAVMKVGRKTAIKLCSTKEDAESYMQDHDFNEKDYYIEFREGKDTRCTEYCNVTKWCPFYRSKYGNL